MNTVVLKCELLEERVAPSVVGLNVDPIDMEEIATRPLEIGDSTGETQAARGDFVWAGDKQIDVTNNSY